MCDHLHGKNKPTKTPKKGVFGVRTQNSSAIWRVFLRQEADADDGQSTPHLPTDDYKLEDTVAVPARRGDVVAFCYYTVHGSYINTTPEPRRIVRVGFRDPHNAQVYGSFHGRSGIMISARSRS